MHDADPIDERDQPPAWRSPVALPSPYPAPKFAPAADRRIAHDQLVRLGAIPDEWLVATGTRQGITSAVMHLPDRRRDPLRPYCNWAGPVQTMTLAEARKLRAVGCNLCPQIKARIQGKRP